MTQIWKMLLHNKTVFDKLRNYQNFVLNAFDQSLIIIRVTLIAYLIKFSFMVWILNFFTLNDLISETSVKAYRGDTEFLSFRLSVCIFCDNKKHPIDLKLSGYVGKVLGFSCIIF